MNKEGSLSINSENIFPIIKKWLYSDHDIFFRELVSNGCDAVTKLKKLDMIGEYTIPEGKELCVKVTADAETKTITFTDNGIGMDANEIDQYINQIAFSGARDFLDKYKDKTNDDQIIGHFGLGFYSAFMVADRVTIDSLSYKEGAKAVHWESDEGTSFEMTDSAKTEIGTTITLYLNEDSYEFCNEYRAKEILDKYCSFMPIPIYFEATRLLRSRQESMKPKRRLRKRKKRERLRKLQRRLLTVKLLRLKLKLSRPKKHLRLLSQSMRLLRFGQSIQMSVPMRSIRSFITEYSMITRSRCSGSI